MLERVGLSAITRIVGQLAHGQRQWVELGVMLSTDPDLVLLDEPAAGMTDQEVLRTAELRAGHQRDQGAHRRGTRHAVHPHDRHQGHGLDQRLVLMEDDVEAIMHSPIVRDVYLGKKAAA